MNNKKIINTKVVSIDDILFKSKSESIMYMLLKDSGLDFNYEPEKIILMPGFYPKNWYCKSIEQSKKIRDITYTPDFVVHHRGYTIYIEVKGFPNDAYKLKKKLFIKYFSSISDAMFFEVHTKRDMQFCIDKIQAL